MQEQGTRECRTQETWNTENTEQRKHGTQETRNTGNKEQRNTEQRKHRTKETWTHGTREIRVRNTGNAEHRKHRTKEIRNTGNKEHRTKETRNTGHMEQMKCTVERGKCGTGKKKSRIDRSRTQEHMHPSLIMSQKQKLCNSPFSMLQLLFSGLIMPH